MSIRELLDLPMLIRARKNLRRNATLLGSDHMFAPNTRVGLSAGAKAQNVVLHDHTWFFGQALLEDEGRFIMYEYSKIGYGCKIQCVDKIEIGAYTAIGDNTVICDNNNHPVCPEYRKLMRQSSFHSDLRLWKHSAHAPISIGENCWIGSNVRICKGVTIGENSVVAANSVVTKDVPANCIAAGNPAKIVKTDIDQIPAPTTSADYNAYLKSKH